MAVTLMKIAIAFLAFVVLMRVGIWAIRFIGTEPPPPPPAGELRKVDARFRCDVCGMEMKVVLAPDQEPEPPRHCMEEMRLLVTD